MRVLMISARADHGGGPKHIELLLRHLSDRIEAHVACPDEPPYGPKFSTLTQGRVITIPHRKFRISSVGKLLGYVRRYRINVIHSHGKGAGLYGRILSLLTGTHCVHTPHGIHVGGYGVLVKRLYRLYENWTARVSVDHVVFVSKEERWSAERIGLWPTVSGSVIPNGVESEEAEDQIARRSTTRATWAIGEERPVVVTFSRFDFQKNMAEAYAIARAVPEALFVWAGEGGALAELKSRAEMDNVTNIWFLGAIDDPASVLSAADIYLSTSRWEGLPLAVLEAMARGVPVLLSDVIGHHELVEQHRVGWLYPLGNVDVAVQSLRNLFGDRSLRAELGAGGVMAQRECYSAQQMAHNTEKLYRLVAG